MSPDTQIGAAARNRAAVETFTRHEAMLRRTALRFSLCADDADEALSRGLEILLRKAPSEDPRELVRWTQTVVKHEALALRRERERVLAGPAAVAEPHGEDWTAMIPSGTDGPPEQVERRETVARTREALQRLRPSELRALTLLAEGYSYREIGAITGFSATKVNRALAEGRERFRRFLTGAAEGDRCGELRPLISAFSDGEAGPADAADVREHLRACPHCRATLHAYRAAPRAAAALAPVLPLHRSLVERAHDALAGIVTRVGGGGGGDSTLAGIAAGGGTRGAGVTALAKVLAVCAGTVGGAAACVAGVVPAPLALIPDEPHHVRSAPVHHPHPVRHLVDTVSDESGEPAYEPEPTPAEEEPEPEKTQPSREEADPQPKHHRESAPPVEAATEPPQTEAGAVEYTAPPEETVVAVPEASAPSSAATATSSSSSSSSGTAAGEFGP